MATIKTRKLKSGTVVYDIQIFVDGKLKSKSWRAPNNMSKRESFREAEKIALDFEDSARHKEITFNEDISFAEFSEMWLKECYENNAKTYYVHAQAIVKELNSIIGAIPIKKLAPIHIQRILSYLNGKTITDEKAKLIKPLDEIIGKKKIRKISEECGFSFTTFLYARQGKNIEWKTAVSIAKVLKIDVNSYFLKIDNSRKYSKGSKSKVKRILNTIVNKAVQLDLLAVNPVQKVFVKGTISGAEAEKTVLSLEETRQFECVLHHLKDLRVKSALGLLYYLGMRIGEVGGLEWKDIDFEKKTLSIQRSSIYAGKEFGLITKEPKTKTSKRTLTMPKVLSDILQEYKKSYDSEKQRLLDRWIDTDRVIPQWNGQPIMPGTIGIWLKTLLEKNGLKIVTAHSLRHTNITLQLRAGISPRIVAKNAGHSDPSVTLAVYSHFLKEDNDVSANFFDKFYKENNYITNAY